MKSWYVNLLFNNSHFTFKDHGDMDPHVHFRPMRRKWMFSYKLLYKSLWLVLHPICRVSIQSLNINCPLWPLISWHGNPLICQPRIWSFRWLCTSVSSLRSLLIAMWKPGTNSLKIIHQKVARKAFWAEVIHNWEATLTTAMKLIFRRWEYLGVI